MSEFGMYKIQGGLLRPATDDGMDRLNKIKNGSYVTADIKKVRNPEYHARFFALLNFAYEYFNPVPEKINGIEAVKNFERFRKDVTILAGHREAVVNIRGEVRYEAKSISFGRMDELEFHDLYKSVFEVLWKMVLSEVKGMTPEAAENAVNQLLSFD